MQFSTFQQDLNTWQGSSLIFGIVEEDLKNQLQKIDFIIDSKLLQEQINQKKFKGEKGKILNFDFFDQRLQNLKFIGLGESKNINSNISNYLNQENMEISCFCSRSHPSLPNSQLQWSLIKANMFNGQ